ncbi:MAG: PAS domain-containing sensor histidine kinase [Planctomycetota bacterium]|jgi:PAS domain S-box-containing protein
MDKQKGLAKDQSRGAVSVRFMHLLVGLFAAAVICSMSYIFTAGNRMAAKQIPFLINSAKEIKLKATQAHLWFEEMISGDRTVDIKNVWKLLDLADWHTRGMIGGDENTTDVFVFSEDSDFHSLIRAMQARLEEFRSITRQRYEKPETSATGSRIDQEYDAVFAQLMIEADNLEDQLRQVMKAELTRFQTVQIALIIFCVALAILVAAVFNRFIRKQIKDKQEFLSINQQLRAANQQLVASEQQLQASNEQLQANDQQLRAANQQFRADEQQLRASEHKLQQQSDFLRSTIDSLNHPFYVIDANDYTIKMANIATVDPIDLKEGMTCYELMHRSKRPCSDFNHPCTLERVKATSESVTLEHLHYDKEGNERIFEIHGSPIFDNEGNISQIIEYCIDITARKQAEKTLRESETNYRTIFDSANDAIFVHDIETGAILDCNEKVSEMFGYTPAEVRNLNVGDLSSGKPPYTQQEAVKRIRATVDGTAQLFQWQCRHKKGRLFWVELSLKRVRISGTDRVLVVVRDVSKRVLAQQELKKEKDMAQKYLDVAATMFVGVDTEGKVFLANSRTCEILGWDQSEIIGKNWFDNFLPERLRQEVKSVSARLLAGEIEPTEYYENPVLTRHGRERIIAWHNVLLKNEQGQNIGHLSSGQDITEHKQAQELLLSEKLLSEEYINSLPELFYVFDDQRFVKWNSEWNRITGYSDEELAGKYGTDFFEGQDRALIEERMLDVFRDGAADAEAELVTKDGRRIPYYFTGMRKKLNGKDHLVGLGVDISKRKHAEEQVERIFNTTGYMVCVAGIDGYFKRVNASFEEILGYSAEELLARPFNDFVHPEDRAKTATVVKERLAEGVQVIGFENRYRCKDGSYKWLSWTSRPVVEEGLLYAIAYDITKRKKAEQERQAAIKQLLATNQQLRASEQQLKASNQQLQANEQQLQAANQQLQASEQQLRASAKELESLAKFPSEDRSPVLRISGDGTLLYANLAADSLTKKWGCRPGEAVPEDWGQTVTKVLANNSQQMVEYEHDSRIYSFIVVPIAEASYANLYGRDITMRRQIEEALEESEERFRTVVEQSPAAIEIYEPNGRLLSVNDAWSNFWGLEKETVTDFNIFDDPECERTGLTSAFKEAQKGRSRILPDVFYDSAESALKGGRKRCISTLMYPITDQQENVRNIVLTYTDVTERKQIEAERERLMQALEARTKELQSIVYTASHDLQTPLVTVRGFGGQLTKYCTELIELAGEKSTDKETRQKIDVLLKDDIPEALKFINAGADKMRSLLEGLTSLSRIGTAAIELKPVDMNKLIKGVTRAMRYQIQNNDVSVIIDRKLPGCLGDVSQIDQVFTNLLDNALKYLEPSRKGNIHITGRVENDMSIYRVEDNGIGIADEHLEQIFEIFYQLYPAGPAGGEGLGLTIIRRILGRHNGRIRVESKVGKGSSFFVSLPHAKPPKSTTSKKGKEKDK